MTRLTALLTGLSLLIVGCSDPSPPNPPAGGDLEIAPEPIPTNPPPFRFVDVTENSGLARFRQLNGSAEKRFIVEEIGAGVAFLDYDGDGDLDVYLTTGGSLQGFAPGEEPRDGLFRNQGGGSFVPVEPPGGLGPPGWTVGVTVVDFDADGRPDLYLTRFGENVLLRNRGDGGFEDVTKSAGVGDPRWSTGSAFFDADADGDLDLYVANYVDFDPDFVPSDTSSCEYQGVMVAYGPRGLTGWADRLYRNEGDGRFIDVSADAGVDVPRHYAFQPIPFDVDEDGDLDVFVANDSVANVLWVNDGTGRFTDRALASGLAYSASGTSQACMGAALGDPDADGRFDLFVTNFENDHYTLYKNQGRGLFSDVSFMRGLAQATIPRLGWGCGFEDLDNDGDEDLFIANGHVYPQVDEHGKGGRYRQLNQVFENVGEGRFRDRSMDGGSGLAIEEASRGAAFGDFDDDGDVDVLVGNLDAAPTLLRNESPSDGAWTKVLLLGRSPNRDAIGASVAIRAGGKSWTRLRLSSSSFLSASDPRLHFGLGSAERIDRLEVKWPNGRVQVHEDLPARRLLVAEELSGSVQIRELN